MSNYKRTRVVLKPGFWDETYNYNNFRNDRNDSNNRNDMEDSEIKPFALHLGHLCNLYRNYDVTDTNKDKQNVCIAIIDDTHKSDDYSHIAHTLIDGFINDLHWLRLPRLKIVPISSEFPKIMTYLMKLINNDKVYIQVFKSRSNNIESHEDEIGINGSNISTHTMHASNSHTSDCIRSVPRKGSSNDSNWRDGTQHPIDTSNSLGLNKSIDLQDLKRSPSTNELAQSSVYVPRSISLDDLSGAKRHLFTDSNYAYVNQCVSHSIYDKAQILNIYNQCIGNSNIDGIDSEWTTLKFRLNYPDIQSPLLMVVSNSSDKTSMRVPLNFAIIVIDMVYQINTLIEDYNKLDPLIQAFYNWIFNYFSRNPPKIIYQNSYRIYNFRYFRDRINTAIHNRIFSGWDDPRLLTIAGIRRRGLNPAILRIFCNKSHAEINEEGLQTNYTVSNPNTEYMIPIKSLEETVKLFYASTKIKYQQITGILEPVEIEILNMDENTTYFLSRVKHDNKKSQKESSIQILENYSSQTDREININHNNKNETKEDLITYSRRIWVEKEDTKAFKEGSYVNLRYGIIIQIQKRIYVNGCLKILANESTDAKYVSSHEIPWLSYDDGIPVWADFYLYNKWYLGGPAEKLGKYLQVQCYRGLVDEAFMEVSGRTKKERDTSKHFMSITPILISHLGWFMYDPIQTTKTGTHSLNLTDPFHRVEKIVNNSFTYNKSF